VDHELAAGLVLDRDFVAGIAIREEGAQHGGGGIIFLAVCDTRQTVGLGED